MYISTIKQQQKNKQKRNKRIVVAKKLLLLVAVNLQIQFLKNNSLSLLFISMFSTQWNIEILCFYLSGETLELFKKCTSDIMFFNFIEVYLTNKVVIYF